VIFLCGQTGIQIPETAPTAQDEHLGLPSYFFPEKLGVLPILKALVERCILGATLGALHIRLERQTHDFSPDHVAAHLACEDPRFRLR